MFVKPHFSQHTSVFQREERRGCSPTQRRLFCMNSGSPSQSPTGVDIPQTIFTRDLQANNQTLEHGGDLEQRPFKRRRFEGDYGENQPSPSAANANCWRHRRHGGRRPSCPRGGVQRATNGAAWEVSRRYGASNIDGMDNEAAEADLQEENFSPGNYSEQLDQMQPEPENPALPILGSQFISTIATTAQDIHASPIGSTCSNNVQAVLDALQGKTQLLSTEELMSEDSLASLATRCERADQTAQAADLVYMLSCMELRAKVIRYVYLLFYLPINANLIYLYQYFL